MAWPTQRSHFGFSPTFRWALRAMAIGALVVLAYQLTHGDLCMTRHYKVVCTTGTTAYFAGFALVAFCAGIVALSFRQRRAESIEYACWWMAGLSSAVAVVISFFT